VHVAVENLSPGDWRLRRWSVDPGHSSRWDAEEGPWLAAEHDSLEMVEQRAVRVGSDRRLAPDVELPPSSSVFVLLRPESHP
jgi:hypothetical protein